MRKAVIFFIVLLAFWACSPQVPNEYIQPDDMEDILYDYHLAQSMAEEGDADKGHSTFTKQTAYRSAVLRKHGVSEAEFDTSFVYYVRHTERLQKIYEHLAKRLTNEAQSLGATASDINRFGSQLATGDTANVWIGEKSVILSPYVPFNQYSFTIKADTAFHKGDRILLQFKPQFIYQDGVREGMAYLSIVYSNDSIATQSRQISSDSQQTLDIADGEGLGIKEVKGFFYLGNGRNQSQTTLKLMCISDIALIRLHQQPKPQRPKENTDSLLRQRAIDSAKQARPQVTEAQSLQTVDKENKQEGRALPDRLKPITRQNVKLRK